LCLRTLRKDANEAILSAGQIKETLQELDMALCLGLQAQSSDMGE
jgi:hypothetical protein